jgi:hypothetical protein
MAIPFLNNISLNNNEIQNVKLHNTGTILSPAAGHIYFDTDDNIAKYYNGSGWIDIGAGTDVDVSVTNLITRLGQISEDVTIGDAADVTVIIPGDLQVTGTTTTNNVETVSTSNGVIFEGNAADTNELTLLAGALTADQTITLPDATGTVALTSDLHDAVTLDGGYDYITLSGQQLTLNQIDYTTDIANTPTIPSALATAAALIDVSAMGSNTTASFTHSLSSKNLIVQLYDVTTGEVVFADIDHTSNNAISVIFASTPANDIRVVIIDAKDGLTDKTVTYS